jgi:hypothetical protein
MSLKFPTHIIPFPEKAGTRALPLAVGGIGVGVEFANNPRKINFRVYFVISNDML